MKKLLILFIATISIVACTKDDPIDIQQENPIIENPTIENTLITGSNCTSFYRLIEGSGMEDIHSVKQTPDGGYILCGSTETIAENESDILVIKTDCFGETDWIKTISNDFSDYGYDIILISTGEYLLVANYALDPSGTQIISYQGQLIKITSSGEVIWKKQYNFGYSTLFNKVTEVSDGGFIICGLDDSNGGFVFKTDASGTETWRNVFKSNTRLYDITIAASLNYIVCGSVNINQQDDIFVAELNIMGDTLWTTSLDKNNITNEAISIVTLGNEIIISGYNRTSGIELPGFAMKLNATGNEIWYKSLQIDGIEQLTNIIITQDNEILGVGSKSNLLSLVKMSSNNGSIIWQTNKQTNPIIRDMQLTNDAGFILTGNLFVASGNRDGFMLKTDLNGN